MAEEVGSSVVGKVVDLLFGVIKTETSYMWNCTQNLEKFKNEVEKLRDMKGRIQQQIDIAKSQGDDLIVGVEKWVEEAAQQISKAQEFLEQEANAKKTCFKIGICGNWATLHRYGKTIATKMTPSVVQLQERGGAFVSCVSLDTPAPGPLEVHKHKNLEDLDSHNAALKDIIAALEDESKQIIGIHGLGGVGKTTLAKEVVTKVKHLFADVAFTTVSQTVKVQEIQKDTINARKRIMKGEKVLIILDDIWEKLDLEELCIPINQTNCKILLTSRSEKVCQKMNAQSKIYVDSLPTREAWILFKRVVGERVEKDGQLKLVAEEVAKECGGLPLLIQAVGNALKDESIHSWKAALSRLKKPATSEMDPDIEKAFTRLQLSYDYLKSEEAKSCFLLCSMYPEDSNIWLEQFVYYMVGLGKFNDLESMEDARQRVGNAVNILRSSGLLLNVEDEEPRVKMHDVVRDVALLIASQDNNKFLVKAGQDLTEWLPRDNNVLKSYTGISLKSNKISKLPDYEVHLPSLEIFLVNNNYRLSMISDKFIEGMKEVKVLDMSWCMDTRLPQSLKLLTKLRMLDLEGNESFNDISLFGEMKELEILNLNWTGIKEIPKEIGRLVNLRRLEVSGCRYMTHVTPGVISKLQSLEELRIDLFPVREGVYECLIEVMKLYKLTYLDIVVKGFDLIPEGFNLEYLKSFVIQIGEFDQSIPLKRPDGYLTNSSYLMISSEHLVIPLANWLKKLIKVSRPHILLCEIENLYNMMPTMYNEGFNKLEGIRLCRCPNVSCLVDDGDDGTKRCDGDEGITSEKYFMGLKHLELWRLNKLEVLWKCPDEYISLTNLVTLNIEDCLKLKRLFAMSVAQGLVNLKKLVIICCYGLEEVIYGFGNSGEEINRGSEEIVEQQRHSSSSYATNTKIIVFPSLVLISLADLGLKTFYSGGSENCSIKYPSLVDVYINDCERMKIWGPGIHETPNLKSIQLVGDRREDVRRLPLNGANAINDVMAKLHEESNKHKLKQQNEQEDDDNVDEE